MGWFRRTPDGSDGAPMSLEERLAQLRPGVPGRCPACDGLGYIDSIDIGHRYQIQHCKDCLHRWEYLFDGDGAVVGLTELDHAGRPIARSRIRPAGGTSEEPESDTEPDVVLDLRDAPGEPAGPGSAAVDEDASDAPEATQLSPAEWLRRSLQR